MTPAAAIVILGAGSGSRVGHARNKVLLPVAGRPLLAWSVRTALAIPEPIRLVVVCRPGEQEAVARAVLPELTEAGDREAALVEGGATRHASEMAALRAMAAELESGAIDVVAIHDGARPLATVGLFTDAIATARAYGGAVPVVRLPGLVARSPGPAERRGLVGVQTPQAFRAEPLLAAYRTAETDGFEGTDTAASIERIGAAGFAVRAIDGDSRNLKVTYADDVTTAARLLARRH